MLEEKNNGLHESGNETPSETPTETEEGAAEITAENDTGDTIAADDDAHAEIDAENAEDAEDETNKQRYSIPMPDYQTMTMEALASELEKLVNDEKVQAIRKHVDEIKHEFDLKTQEFLDRKKEDFINDGGNEIDFKYTSPVITAFNQSYSAYKEKRNQYYKNLEQTLKANLAKRLEIIEALKALINVEEDINTTYKTFKELQDQWRKAGPVPRVHYNDVWKTYGHHVEIFYDFLDLNRELRDIDFRKNLEEKEKIIAKAEGLLKEEDIHKAFRELQLLHKIWKEDIGPVDREYRESIWERFSAVTKIIHQKRQEYYKNINVIQEQNLLQKQEIIAKIKQIAETPGNSHSDWRKQIDEIETLRETFLKAGRVPYNAKEQIWADFKEAYKSFNRNKNAFYRELKKEQQQNLKKKMELLEIAESLKDSEDWEKTTPVMKAIQLEWKAIGHIPRKHSNTIWERFKNACNHYFNRLHEQRNKAERKQSENLNRKKELLNKLTAFVPGDVMEENLKNIQEIVREWKILSSGGNRRRNLEDKFNKTIDQLFNKLNIDKQQAELIKYGNKLEHLSQNDALLNNERLFVRRRINELKGEIRQLENNLQFFNAKADNPIVKEVVNKINKHKDDLSTWEAKLKKLRSL